MRNFFFKSCEIKYFWENCSSHFIKPNTVFRFYLEKLLEAEEWPLFPVFYTVQVKIRRTKNKKIKKRWKNKIVETMTVILSKS